MKAQVLLTGGPHDMAMVVLHDLRGEWPEEIRVASGDDGESPSGKIPIARYMRHDVQEGPSKMIFLGAYNFVGMLQSSKTLVDVWI